MNTHTLTHTNKHDQSQYLLAEVIVVFILCLMLLIAELCVLFSAFYRERLNILFSLVRQLCGFHNMSCWKQAACNLTHG